MTDSELMQLSEQVGQALKARGATVTTAESCTGGWVAKVITDIAGSSAWFERGFVTYSNEAKAQMIGVREETLAQHGAVSEPAAPLDKNPRCYYTKNKGKALAAHVVSSLPALCQKIDRLGLGDRGGQFFLLLE